MKHYVCALWLCIPFYSHSVEQDSINISITGGITDSTCEIAQTDQNKQVQMGTYLAQNFKQVNDVSDPVDFTIQLENCGPDTKEVRVEFTGTSAGDGSLLALDSNSISQLAIRILDSNKSPITLNDNTNSGRSYNLTPGAANQTLQFYAQYVALRVPLDTGEADATAKLSLTWP